MASNYERIFYNDYEKALTEIERLIAKLSDTEALNAQEISEIEAQYAEAINAQWDEFYVQIIVGTYRKHQRGFVSEPHTA